MTNRGQGTWSYTAKNWIYRGRKKWKFLDKAMRGEKVMTVAARNQTKKCRGDNYTFGGGKDKKMDNKPASSKD